MSEQARVGSTSRVPLVPDHPPTRSTSGSRVVAGFVFAACVCLISLSLWLKPDASGFGTHRQLGLLFSDHPLPACTSIVLFGLPCPTCGMTTAFAHAFRGHLLASARAQPAGAVFAMCVAACAFLSAYVAVTGRRLPRFRRITPTRVIVGLAIVMVLGWLVKLLEAMYAGTLNP